MMMKRLMKTMSYLLMKVLMKMIIFVWVFRTLLLQFHIIHLVSSLWMMSLVSFHFVLRGWVSFHFKRMGNGVRGKKLQKFRENRNKFLLKCNIHFVWFWNTLGFLGKKLQKYFSYQSTCLTEWISKSFPTNSFVNRGIAKTHFLNKNKIEFWVFLSGIPQLKG